MFILSGLCWNLYVWLKKLFPLDNQLYDNPLIWFDINNFILMSEEKLNENKNVLLPERKLEKNICVMKCYFCTALQKRAETTHIV